MNKKTKALIVIALFAAAIAAVLIVPPVSAASGIDTTPQVVLQGEYLTPAQIRAADHIGIGISMEFIGENERIRYFSGSTYLNGVYRLQESHNEQDQTNFKSYVCSIPELAPRCREGYRELLGTPAY